MELIIGASRNSRIQHAANVNVKNSHGFTPLHWAAQFGKLKACSTLLANGADPTAKVAASGFSPLHLAAQEGHKHVSQAKCNYFTI